MSKETRPPIRTFTYLHPQVGMGLELIFPVQRDLFEEMYTEVGDGLAFDATAMESFTIEELREESAILRIHTTEDEGGTLVPHTYPMHLLRAEDGRWWIYDY